MNSQKRHDSAKLIQKNWKIYKQIILIPRKELEKQVASIFIL